MKEVSKQNFGLLIAYLLPGLVVLWGASFFSETVRVWLKTGDQASPTIAGFLYVTLAAFTAGLTLSAVRTVSIDILHHRTGVPKPDWDFSDFQAKFWAFNQLVESHYYLYQFYAHMCLALPALVAARIAAQGEGMDWRSLAGCLLLEVVLLVVSRGTLVTYYTRASHLLGTEKGALSRALSNPKPSRNGRSKQSEVTIHSSSPEQTSERLNDRLEPGKVTRW